LSASREDLVYFSQEGGWFAAEGNYDSMDDRICPGMFMGKGEVFLVEVTGHE
jgi:hypothetical protein